MNTNERLGILACNSGRPFANKILKTFAEKRVEASLIKSEEVTFANSEIKTVIGECIRDVDLYIVQDVENSTTGLSIDQNVRALTTAIDAARRSNVCGITVVVPVFPYARQDKQKGRECITAANIAQEIEDKGADQVFTLDVHNTAIEGYFRKATFENLRAAKNITDYIKNNTEIDINNLVVMPPDTGGAERAEVYASIFGVNLVFAYKRRNYKIPNSVSQIDIVGDVNGKEVLVVDDMVDTGGTLVKAIEKAKEKGAKKVYAACSLPLFNGDALEKMDRLYKGKYIAAFFGTDAVYHGEYFHKKHPWFTEVSVASYFAKAINKVHKKESISALLE